MPKNFAPTTLLYLGEAFEVPRNFSRKVSCVGVWGRSPNIQCAQKNAEKSAFFILSSTVGTAVREPCFKELLKKLLKNPKNFCTNHTTLFGLKLLRFQRTFREKSFVSGFGADSPNIQCAQKNAEKSAFFILQSKQ